MCKDRQTERRETCSPEVCPQLRMVVSHPESLLQMGAGVPVWGGGGVPASPVEHPSQLSQLGTFP